MSISCALVLLLCPGPARAGDLIPPADPARPLVEAGAPFGELPLVDEIDCASPRDKHPFRESSAEVSVVGGLLGRDCRVLRPAGAARWMAWRIGAGKGLLARGAYVLEIEMPDDRPRTTIVVNRGCDMVRGVATAGALGDQFWGREDSRAEVLDRLPHARRFITQKLFFFLHDRTADIVLTRAPMRRPLLPADGFWVVVLTPSAADDPVSSGAAVSRIRLFEVPDPGQLTLEPKLPEGLPHRLVFAREAWSAPMTEGDGEGEAGVDNMDAFFEFRARQARFLGMNAVAPDLLTANRNQGWDSGEEDWYASPRDALRWEKMLQMLDGYGLSAVPYFEYAGSLSLNRAVRCQPISRGLPYTNDPAGEPGHLDVTDPLSLDDARRLMERTVGRYRDRFRIAAVWFRVRTGAWPVSYADAAIKRFAADANGNWPPPRSQFAEDSGLRERYDSWWMGKRAEFLSGVRDAVRSAFPKAEVLVTPWGPDGGPALSERTRLLVTDVPADFMGNLQGPGGQWGEALAWKRAVGEERWLKALQAFPRSRGSWDWHDACPPPDPGRYWDTKGVLFTFPIPRAFTAASATAFDAFRGPDGLAVERVWCRNAGVDSRSLGGIVGDVDRAGAFCMMVEALAVANGDPWWIANDASNTHTSSFPEVTRRFYSAFLALPALRSQRMPEWSEDPDVVVRVIWTEKSGAYLAVVNSSPSSKKEALVVLPWDGPVTNASSGQILDSLKVKVSPKPGAAAAPKAEAKPGGEAKSGEKPPEKPEEKTGIRIDLGPFELVALKVG